MILPKHSTTSDANRRIQRPSGYANKRLCVITLTRIYVLTQEYPTLVREITTPCLGSFIQSCLNLTKSKLVQQRLSYIVAEVLAAFAALMPLHPTSFRPYLPQIHTLVSKHIAPTPSNTAPEHADTVTSQLLCNHARRLFVLLHVCAPKNTAGEAWMKSLQEVIACLHRTADLVFRGLVEDWTPKLGRSESNTSHVRSLDEIIADSSPTHPNLPGWTGIEAGLERVDGLLGILQCFILTSTSIPVTIPVYELLEAVDRVLSALAPSDVKSGRTRPEIDREERDALYLGLTMLHVSAMHFLSVMLTRFRLSLSSVIPGMLEQTLWVFEHEQANQDIRIASYGFVALVLSQIGPSIPKHLSEGLSYVFEHCCEDIVPSSDSQESNTTDSSSSKLQAIKGTVTSTDASISPIALCKSSVYSSASSKAQAAALKLLPLTLTHLPKDFLSVHLRTRIDRTAILTAHMEGMLGSTMNPPAREPRGGPAISILPFLSQLHGDVLGVEALIHPQMPVSRPQIENVDGVDLGDGKSLHSQYTSLTGEAGATHGLPPNTLEEHVKQVETAQISISDSARDPQSSHETRAPYRDRSGLNQGESAAALAPTLKRSSEQSLINETSGVSPVAPPAPYKKPRLQADRASNAGNEYENIPIYSSITENLHEQDGPTKNTLAETKTSTSWNLISTVPERLDPEDIAKEPESGESDFEIPPLETGDLDDLYGPSEEEDNEEEEEEKEGERG